MSIAFSVDILNVCVSFVFQVNYQTIGRALALSNLNISCLRPKWIAWIFFGSDCASFGLQVRKLTCGLVRLPEIIGIHPATSVVY